MLAPVDHWRTTFGGSGTGKPTSSVGGGPPPTGTGSSNSFSDNQVREVAAILRCGRNQAYELIQRGEIRSVRIGRAIRVTREALEEFKAGREAASGA